MDENTRKTQRIELEDADMLEALLKQKNRELGTSRLGKTREVILLIEDGMVKIELHNDVAYLLGRFNKSKPRANHVDLSQFKALDRGISRIHAQIHMDNDTLYLTDLDSTNGTYVDGIKLIAHQQKQLRQNSEILLGKLTIQIMYKSHGDTDQIKPIKD